MTAAAILYRLRCGLDRTKPDDSVQLSYLRIVARRALISAGLDDFAVVRDNPREFGI